MEHIFGPNLHVEVSRVLGTAVVLALLKHVPLLLGADMQKDVHTIFDHSFQFCYLAYFQIHKRILQGEKGTLLNMFPEYLLNCSGRLGVKHQVTYLLL